jgi:hypothetical protein
LFFGVSKNYSSQVTNNTHKSFIILGEIASDFIDALKYSNNSILIKVKDRCTKNGIGFIMVDFIRFLMKSGVIIGIKDIEGFFGIKDYSSNTFIFRDLYDFFRVFLGFGPKAIIFLIVDKN